MKARFWDNMESRSGWRRRPRTNDGGFSSMGMSRRAMKTYEKGMRFEDVHENQYPFGK